MADRLAFRGCPMIINAAGTLTRLSGGALAPGVLEAMAEADGISADMFEVQAHASRAIAEATGAEAGLVTSGAGAGLLLATAACLARLDVACMNSLPDSDGPTEIVVSRGHRNGYDHALRAAGARLVEIGMAEGWAGAGIRDAEPWEYEAAIGPNTAALFYVASDRARPALAEVVAVAQRHDLPLIVDAAAELPPAGNLTRFVSEGADLVVFSGGKVLGGPAGTGLLAGRHQLIMSAAMQMLDVDFAWSDWQPPTGFIDKTLLRGLPRQGIGRCCKVGKHEVFGLLAALHHFLGESDATRHSRWLEACERIRAGLLVSDEVTVTVEGAEHTGRVPIVVLTCADADQSARMRAGLIGSEAAVHTGTDPFRSNCLIINPVCLRPAEVPRLIEAVSRWLSGAQA
jgi:L-seryl-tRNA(Ser) seleniumtransferase